MGRRPNDGGQHGRTPLIDRILAAYAKTPGLDLQELDLTVEEGNILERWIFIDGLIRKHRPNLKMKDIEAMTRRRFGISSGQFWADYRHTDRLFGTSFSLSKEYERVIMIEHFKQIASLAEARGDYKSQIAALKEASLLMDLYNFEKDAPADAEPTKFVMVITGDSGGEMKMISLDELNRVSPAQYKQIVDVVDQPLITVETVEQMLIEESDE